MAIERTKLLSYLGLAPLVEIAAAYPFLSIPQCHELLIRSTLVIHHY